MQIINNHEYQWRQNWVNPIAHSDIKSVVDELFQIQEVRGKVTAEYIIASAQNKNSVLHRYFLWDDQQAAHQWRIRQANALLHNIEVKVSTDDGPKFIKAFEITTISNSKLSGRPKSISFYADMDRVKEITIEDLKKGVSRLLPFAEFVKAIEHIQKAIEELEINPSVQRGAMINDAVSV